MQNVTFAGNRCYFEGFSKPDQPNSKDDGIDQYKMRFTFFGLIPGILKAVGFLTEFHYGPKNEKVILFKKSDLNKWVDNHKSLLNDQSQIKNLKQFESSIEQICSNFKKSQLESSSTAIRPGISGQPTPASDDKNEVKKEEIKGNENPQAANEASSNGSIKLSDESTALLKQFNLDASQLKTGNWVYNKQGPNVHTILHQATINGNEELVKVLLATPGIKIDEIKDKYGKTPLHNAAQKGNEAIVLLLLEAGASDVRSNPKDEDSTASLLALSSNEQNAEKIKTIIRKKAPVKKEPAQETPVQETPKDKKEPVQEAPKESPKAKEEKPAETAAPASTKRSPELVKKDEELAEYIKTFRKKQPENTLQVLKESSSGVEYKFEEMDTDSVFNVDNDGSKKISINSRLPKEEAVLHLAYRLKKVQNEPQKEAFDEENRKHLNKTTDSQQAQEYANFVIALEAEAVYVRNKVADEFGIQRLEKDKKYEQIMKNAKSRDAAVKDIQQVILKSGTVGQKSAIEYYKTQYTLLKPKE